ncbi:wall-associated receptor kinase-like 20 [Abrus precatorius]|uniref:Wall-associated receptor kinase-like 20 n=1 Tax=Abrus precatorius TaxID=3816 RepID=A0A8B8L4B9_ABRPR|nr:wall-associated receptor kinase-like 20 [Abrus precatorius]
MAVTLLLFVLTVLGLGPVINASVLNNACSDCGDSEVPYPLSTNEYCGDKRYKIFCNNGKLEFLSTTGTFYKILRIDPSANKLVISPPPILENTCFSSDLLGGGLVLDETLPFNISTHNTVMLFNCSDNILLSPLNCSSKSFCRQFEEKVEEGSGCMDTLCCHYLKDSAMNSHKIRLRVGSCTAYTCLVDYRPDDPLDTWNYGIELQWLSPN